MKTKIFCLVLFILGIISLLTGSYFIFLQKRIYVGEYQSLITQEVKNEYIDDIPKVCYGTFVNCDILNADISGEVDTNTVGEYQLKYKYHYLENEEEIIRTVSVVDSTPPELTFEGEIKYCKNGKALGDNFSAIDNYDGDIKDKVIVKEYDDGTYLEVSDENSNLTKKNVVATLDESVKTNIELTSGKVYILVGNKYEEPGYKAIDPCDGDITDKVVVTNNIKTSTAGSYNVTYVVENSTGNKTTIKRDVAVIKKNSVIYPTGKTIYLTFDDGPGPYTKKLLDILDKYNVKATFFVTNQFSNNTYLSYIKDEAARGHAVGVHSYSHNYKIYKSVDAYFSDLNKMNEVIKKQTGSYSYIVRFPGGSSNTVSRSYAKGIMKTLANELTNRGYVYFDWNLSSGDAGGCTTSSCVYNNVKKYLKGNYVNILMHDIKSYTVNAVEDVIKYGLEKGYTFLPITTNSPTFHQKIAN